MKRMLGTLACAATLATASLAQASQVYDYSYSFIDGSLATLSVTGSFTGDASGNLITNLSSISLSVDGTPFNGPLFGQSYDDSIPDFVSGTAIASFDGTANNFLFIDCDYTNFAPCLYTNYFYAIPFFSGDGTTDSAFLYSADQNIFSSDGEGYSAIRWSVTERQSIPEPGSLALAAIALLGLAASRRKHQA